MSVKRWKIYHYREVHMYIKWLTQTICLLATLLLGYTSRVLVISYQLPWKCARSTKRTLNFSFCKLSEKVIQWPTIFISLLESSLNYLTFQPVRNKVIWPVKLNIFNLLTFLFFSRAFLQWQVVTGMEAEKSNGKLGKLCMIFKSTKCCLHFTSAFDWQKKFCGFVKS